MRPQFSSTKTAKLVAAVAVATAECTAIMNQQFVALMSHDPNGASFDVELAAAIERRKLAMSTLLNHIGANGW